MKRLTTLFAAASLTAVLSACAMNDTRNPSVMYDLSPFSAAKQASLNLKHDAPPRIAIHTPDWLESAQMIYRLDHVNPQQVRSYNESRWGAPPSTLLHERFEQFLLRDIRDPASSKPVRISLYVDDFSQHFSSGSESTAQIHARAVVRYDSKVKAVKNFSIVKKTPTPDAAGGAMAMREAADELIMNVLTWADDI